MAEAPVTAARGVRRRPSLTIAAINLCCLAAGTAAVWAASGPAWWAPVAVGVTAGLLIPGRAGGWLTGIGAGLLGWTLPLAWYAQAISLGRAATVVSALLGYSAPAIPLLATMVFGAGLGACGTWLGRALRSFAVRR